jgi:hypothetical protein
MGSLKVQVGATELGLLPELETEPGNPHENGRQTKNRNA